jgi:hypothetical protein
MAPELLNLKMRNPLVLLLFGIFVFATCKTNKQAPIEHPLTLIPDVTTWGTPDSLKHLLPILDSVWYRDQMYRHELHKGTKQEQVERLKVFKKRSKIVDSLDQLNLRIVEDILQHYGWLGPRDVGLRGVFALSLTIQHSDLKTQEKYLPLLKQAAIDKKTTADSYAMLADRVAIKNYRPQIYGTQVAVLKDGTAEVLPLSNPDSVDFWRKSINIIQSMEEYLKIWHTKWNKDEYKQKLPELKRKYKILDQ